MLHSYRGRLYCGFEDAIEVFDIQSPGEGTRLRTTPSKKSRDGLKGIISSLAFSLDVSSGLYAAGSLSPSPPSSSNIALFTESTGEVPVMFVGDENQEIAFGVRASVMQLMFNPSRPYLLYASFRRHPRLYCWDLRGDVSIPIQTFDSQLASQRTISHTTENITNSGVAHQPNSTDSYTLSSPQTQTNQKLRFDIDIGGNWLGIGDSLGSISLFDLASGEVNPPSTIVTRIDGPELTFPAHDDVIGSVGFHPLQPVLLSVSGSRHFDNISPSAEDPVSDSGPDSEDESESEARDVFVRRQRQRPQPSTHDSSIKLWSFKKGGSGNQSSEGAVQFT